jgi:hypothetical protein
MLRVQLSALARPRRPKGRAGLLPAGLLAASVCAPAAVFAQNAPAAAPTPLYRGIVTLPPAGGQDLAPPAGSPGSPSPSPSVSPSASPSAPPSAPGDPQYRGIVTLPPVGSPGTAPSAETPATASPPAAAAATVPAPTTPATSAATGHPWALPPETAPEGAITGRPIIRDTATLVIDGRAILLASIEGVGGAPLSALKDLVAEQGGTVTCRAANAGPYTYTCSLPDGSDLAMAALVNGAARLGTDPPSTYRAQEASARMNRRGIWALNDQPRAEALPPCASNRAVR